MAQDPAPENAESIILDYISEHPGADARWHEDTNNALEAMRAGAVVR